MIIAVLKMFFILFAAFEIRFNLCQIQRTEVLQIIAGV
jgi:hypothetical protein